MRIIVLFILITITLNVKAVCQSTTINPITDVQWSAMFPMKIGGVVTMGNSTEQNTHTSDANTVCHCNVGGAQKIGINVEFWEPARIQDTVSEPWCMMPLGSKMESGTGGQLSGSYRTQNGIGKIFQQAHDYIFPAFAILDLYTDLPCLDYDEEDIFKLSMVTEPYLPWNDDVYSNTVNPEAILFANPVAQLACAADATAAVFDSPINALYWCAGGWGSVYPLAGSATATDYVEGNALLAARMVYLTGRLGILEEFDQSGCYRHYTAFWNKNRYKFQLAKPVRAATPLYIGKPGVLWTSGKHPLINSDNFMWIMFRKVTCCVSAS